MGNQEAEERDKEPGQRFLSTLFCCLVVQLCLTLCNPGDCSTPGFHTLNIYIHVSTTSIQLEKLESLLRAESK